MKIVADENIPPPLIEWLRAEGCEVLSVRESHRGAKDPAVLQWARETESILLTSDRDFGELVVRRGKKLPGLLLLRFRVRSFGEFFSLFQKYWPEMREMSSGQMMIVSNHIIRVRPLA